MASTNDLYRYPTILGSWTQTDDGIWHIANHMPRRMGEDTPTYLTRIQKNEDERMRYMLMGKTDSEQRIWYNNASAAERDAKKKEIRQTVRAGRWWHSWVGDNFDKDDDEALEVFMLSMQCENLRQALEWL